MADNGHMSGEKKIDEDWKRKASAEKEELTHAAGPAAAESAPSAGISGGPSAETTPGEHGPSAEEIFDSLPPFISLVAQLGIQASILLGLVENPVSGKAEIDLNGARRVLDTLSVLQEKTKGNLDQQESGYLEDLLYRLRMEYVTQKKG